eukprot:3981838-Prymnesium_polylepis.1
MPHHATPRHAMYRPRHATPRHTMPCAMPRPAVRRRATPRLPTLPPCPHAAAAVPPRLGHRAIHKRAPAELHHATVEDKHRSLRD